MANLTTNEIKSNFQHKGHFCPFGDHKGYLHVGALCTSGFRRLTKCLRRYVKLPSSVRTETLSLRAESRSLLYQKAQNKTMNTVKYAVNLYKSLKPGGISATYDVPAALSDTVAVLTTPTVDGAERANELVIDQLMYHKVFTGIRNRLSAAIEEHSKKTTHQTWISEKRLIDGKERDVITEDNEAYVKRALANGVVDIPWLESTLQTICSDPAIAFAVVAKTMPRVAGSGSIKLPKDIEALAKQIVESGEGPAIAKGLAKKLGIAVDGTSIASIGAAIKAKRIADKARETTELRKLAGLK